WSGPAPCRRGDPRPAVRTREPASPPARSSGANPALRPAARKPRRRRPRPDTTEPHEDAWDRTRREDGVVPCHARSLSGPARPIGKSCNNPAGRLTPPGSGGDIGRKAHRTPPPEENHVRRSDGRPDRPAAEAGRLRGAWRTAPRPPRRRLPRPPGALQ